MKNVINKTTGAILQIDKTHRGEEKLSYTYYDNGAEYAIGLSRGFGTEKIDKNIVSDQGYNYNNFMDYISEQSLLALNAGSELAIKANQCWVFNKGAGNVNNTLRVSIPNNVIGKYMFTDNDLDTLIASYRTVYAAYTAHGTYCTVIYMITLSASDRLILEAYANEGIIIENKI
jgi:hypothetical protein